MATSRVPVPPPPNVPATMEAAAIDRFGPPEELTLHTRSVPELGPNEVLIALHAAGVGIWDAKIRDGTWATGKERFPLVLGTDGAGVVAAKGPHVRRFHVGDRVWAYAYENPKGGFYADFVAVDAQHVGRVPERLDLQHAGAAAVTGLTALQGIDEHLLVRAGETVLVFGASGAVGTLAIQFAKHREARVVGTATGRDATNLVERLGADAVIDGRSEDAVERLGEAAPAALAAVLALAGGEVLERCLELVKAGGRVAYPNPPREVSARDAIASDPAGGVDSITRRVRPSVSASLLVTSTSSTAPPLPFKDRYEEQIRTLARGDARNCVCGLATGM